jgi:hypothetical protein
LAGNKFSSKGKVMNKSKLYLAIPLLFLLAACGPVTPVPAPAVIPTLRPTATSLPTPQPTPWPSLKTGWMTFDLTPTILDAVYDHAGHIWETTSNGLYRWDIATDALDQYSSSDGLPESISAITFYEKKLG